MKPVGVGGPQFKGAPRKRGVYTISPQGSVWFGSPVPEIAAALVSALARRTEIVWAAARLRIQGFTVEVGVPTSVEGLVELKTATRSSCATGAASYCPMTRTTSSDWSTTSATRLTCWGSLLPVVCGFWKQGLGGGFQCGVPHGSVPRFE